MIDLVARASQGDHVAFVRLAVQIAPRLDAIARLMLADSDRAADAVRRSLVRTWVELPRLRDRARFEAWTNRLVVEACLDQLASDPHTDRPDVSAGVRTVAQGDAPAGDRDDIAAGLDRLEPRSRAALVLHYYLGLGPDGIAETLSMPKGTGRALLDDALGAMRAALEVEAPTTGSAGSQ